MALLFRGPAGDELPLQDGLVIGRNSFWLTGRNISRNHLLVERTVTGVFTVRRKKSLPAWLRRAGAEAGDDVEIGAEPVQLRAGDRIWIRKEPPEPLEEADAARMLDVIEASAPPPSRERVMIRKRAATEEADAPPAKRVAGGAGQAANLSKYKAEREIMGLLSHRDRPLALWGLQAPVEELFPEHWIRYQAMIQEPMDLRTINEKLDRGEYEVVDGTKISPGFVRDVRLVFNNAKSFNVKGSEYHDHAVQMLEWFQLKLAKLTNDRAPAPLNDDAANTSITYPHLKYQHVTAKMMPITAKKFNQQKMVVGTLTFGRGELKFVPHGEGTPFLLHRKNVVDCKKAKDTTLVRLITRDLQQPGARGVCTFDVLEKSVQSFMKQLLAGSEPYLALCALEPARAGAWPWLHRLRPSQTRLTNMQAVERRLALGYALRFGHATRGDSISVLSPDIVGMVAGNITGFQEGVRGILEYAHPSKVDRSSKVLQSLHSWRNRQTGEPTSLEWQDSSFQELVTLHDLYSRRGRGVAGHVKPWNRLFSELGLCDVESPVWNYEHDGNTYGRHSLLQIWRRFNTVANSGIARKTHWPWDKRLGRIPIQHQITGATVVANEFDHVRATLEDVLLSNLVLSSLQFVDAVQKIEGVS